MEVGMFMGLEFKVWGYFLAQKIVMLMKLPKILLIAKKTPQCSFCKQFIPRWIWGDYFWNIVTIIWMGLYILPSFFPFSTDIDSQFPIRSFPCHPIGKWHMLKWRSMIKDMRDSMNDLNMPSFIYTMKISNIVHWFKDILTSLLWYICITKMSTLQKLLYVFRTT